MKNNFTPELIEKAKSAKTEAELLTLAKENGVELTEEQAKAYFEQLHKTGELSDEELDNVAGGGCYAKDGRLIVTLLRNDCDDWKESQRYAVGYGAQLIERDPSSPEYRQCKTCQYMSYEGGVWYCNNPAVRR